jgi:hypothetical protein
MMEVCGCAFTWAPVLLSLVLAIIFACGTESAAQTTVSQQPAAATDAGGVQDEGDRPLPDISALMHQVEAHLQAGDEIRKDYIYHAVEIRQETDGNGFAKKTTVNEYDVFWVNGVPVQKLTKKDGRELTADEQKKENERLDKDIAKARERKDKADAKGKETGPRGDDMISASRILELGNFSNPRRVKLDGRDTIVVDYAGNPKAKTRNRFEDVVRDLVGTVWIDEQDKVIRKTEGHFLNAFKVGAGMVANIRKDSSFGMEQTKVNGEVWLPARLEGRGEFRFLLLVSFDGRVQINMSDYRKFKATSTVLPGVSTVEDGAAGADPQ